MSNFRGVLMGEVYTDPKAFEKAARALGYRQRGKRSDEYRLGVAVAVKLADGERVRGQVWAKTPERGWVWVACDNGKSYALEVRTGVIANAPRQLTIGRVAA